MAPTTVTSIVLVLFALGLLALTGLCWLGSWQPVRRRPPAWSEEDIEAAVAEMRRSIDAYERRERR